MSARFALAVTFVVCLKISAGEAADPLPTGPFVLPFDENQSWAATAPGCTKVGYVNPWDPGASLSHQYHMEWYAEVKKYHMGEDWNGKCGGATDLNAPLYALADGRVQLVDDVGVSSTGAPSKKGKRLDIRYTIPYALYPGGIATFDSVYLHLDHIEPTLATGTKVRRGQLVAYVGGTGGWPVHLHWELQWDKHLPRDTNDYQNPLYLSLSKPASALKYRAPSLIADDRREVFTIAPSLPNTWSTFFIAKDAPSSTAYIAVSGLNKALNQAIGFGWINATDLQYWTPSTKKWSAFPNIDSAFFRKDAWYAFRTRIAGGTLNIPIPKHRFQADRARLDMIHAVEGDATFLSIKSETYTHNPNFEPEWELHKMEFATTGGNRCVAQATGISNRLIRYTAISSAACTVTSATWTPWVLVDWNRLY